MDWYYAEGKERRGPLPETEIGTLVAAGKITPDTLVWNGSMTGWQPARTTSLFPAADGTHVCIITGKSYPHSQLISTEHGWVSAEGRDTYYQCLREGVPFSAASGLPNARRDGKKIVVPVQGARLPLRCVKTNGPVPAGGLKMRTLWWCPPLVFLSILLNILILLILYFVFRKPVKLEIPLSDAGRGIVRKHAFIGAGVALLGIVLLCVGIAYSSTALAGLIVLGGVMVLFGLIWASLKANALRVTNLKNGEVWLAGAGEAFLASLPAYRL
jgi:hypothetical protein